MTVQITIRNVPDKVRAELAARAALRGKSMQEFLLEELGRIAARPSLESWLKQVRRRKQITQRKVSAKQIIESRDADRR